jgi:DNA polymerase-1
LPKAFASNSTPLRSMDTKTAIIVTHKLNEVLAQELVNYAKLYKLYQTIELPLIAVLVTMERNGVELDAR